MTKTSFKKLTSIVLAILMLLSTFVLGEIAANANGTSTVYLKPNANWNKDGARFAIYVFNSGSNAWASREADSVAGVYRASIPSGSWSNIIFCRMNGSTTENNWDNKWNQTDDLTLTGNEGKGYVVADGTWDKGGGSWVSYSDLGGSTPTDPTSGGDFSCYLDSSFCDDGTENWYAWTWTGSGQGHWADAPETDQYGYFKFTGLEEHVVFARVDAANGGPSWDDENNILWNKTSDLDVEEGRLYVIDSWGIGEGTGTSKPLTGYWTDYAAPTTEPTTEITDPTDPTDPTTETPTSTPTQPQTTEPQAPELTDPSSESAPTDPASEDENTSFYVSAKSNINAVGSKVKINGDTITVTYKLTASEALDDGMISVSYDTSKLSLNPAYNTYNSMFPVVTDANYNLSAGTGVVVFNFSGTNGKYDFTKGDTLVQLVFTKKSESTVGTAYVYMKVYDLSSKNTGYVVNGEVKATEGLSVAQAIESKTPEVPTETEVPTSPVNNITVKASSNLNTEVQEIHVDKSHVKVTYKLTAAELITLGDATVTFDDSKLALESRYNTSETMFTTLNSQVSYKLNIAKGMMRFNFTGVNAETQQGAYDFRSGADLITLTFTVRGGAEGVAAVNLNMTELASLQTDYVNAGTVVGTGAVATAEGSSVEDATTSPTSESSVSIATGSTTETNPTIPTGPSTEPTTGTPEPTTDKPTEPTTGTPEPTTAQPTTAQPTTAQPTTAQPTTAAPTTVAPTTAEPTTQAPTTQPATKAPSLTFTKKSAMAGSRFTLGVKNKGSNKVTFTTSNKKIATVTSKGVITTLQKGSATIKVKVGTKTLSCKITVTNNPVLKRARTYLNSKKTYKIKKGKTLVFKLYRRASTIKNVYKSTNKKIAKITSKAAADKIVVKGYKVGKATITIKINGVKTYKMKVKVVK